MLWTQLGRGSRIQAWVVPAGGTGDSDIGLVNGCWIGELRAQVVTPYLSGVPDCDSITLPVRAVDVVDTPLITHRLVELCSAHAAS